MLTMPAETHQHRDPVDTDAVLDLIWLLTAGPDQPDEPRPDAPLAQLDLDDELAVLRLWDAVAEELAERTVAEPALAELLAASSVGELAEVITDTLRG
jgi:hypothetical protein